MNIIKGPADADHYRVQVGRFGDRWYTDPLPGTKHWPQIDATYPSISTVKKASGQDWSFVSIGRIAKAPTARLEEIARLADGERADAINSLNKRGLEAAASRGTMVHLVAEAILRGTPEPLVPEDSPAFAYLPALRQFFDEHQPKLVAAEYVVINRSLNGVGYGGTPDAVVDIGGQLYAIDWKTRTETSNHGAYPEEGAQIAAGAFGDYMIVEGEHGPERAPLPQLAGGLVISIKPDGCRVYPIDLAAAWNHWEALHAWWCARRNERNAISKPWAPGKRRSDANPARVEAVAAVSIPTPDEGAEIGEDVVDPLRQRYVALPSPAWINALRAEAVAAGCDFHLTTKTMRRARLMDGLMTLVEAEVVDDDALRAICAMSLGDTSVQWPTVPLGAAVGAHGAVEAAGFASICEAFVAGRYRLVAADDAPASLEAA